ncbi:Holin [Lactiplantibacillus plajomi]
MSDAVAVALITTVGSVLVAILTQVATVWKTANSDDKGLKQENEELRRKNKELQEIVDYYRKRDDR